MKTRQSKIKGILFAIFLLGAFVCTLLGAFTLNTPVVVHAVLKTPTASLFLPESYDQYLELTQPSYTAISSRHVAIADGNNLFIYDRTEGKYTRYEHNGLNSAHSAHKVTNVQIAEHENGDRIFFSDEGGYLFEYNSNAPTAEEMLINNVSCSTFLIDPSGDYLFTATSSENSFTFHRYVLAEDIKPANGADSETVSTNVIPRMTYYDGKLYCVIDTSALWTYSVQKENGTEKLIRTEFNFLNSECAKINGLQSLCAYNGMLYYTVNGQDATQNGIWQADFSGNATHIETGDGFSTLSVYADGLYCIKDASILKLAENGTCPSQPTYEISSSSPSVNRLSGAVDSVRAGDLLVTADTGNSRISVYDMRKNRFTVIPTEYAPTLVATDGQIVAAAAENAVYTYACDNIGNWSERTEDRVVLEAADPVKGIACVFGKVYFASEHHRGETGRYQLISGGTPAGLASDLYGDLFLAMSDRSVFRFTEEEFCGNSSGKQLEFTLPEGFTSLRSDFEGNLYCLDAEGTFYWNGEAYAEIDGADHVYMQEDKSVPAVSFALGYESDEVYFLFHTFMVKTNAGELGFPSLGTIGAEDIYENTGRVQEPDAVTYVDVQSGAVGIEVDLSLLTAETAYFPYAAYSRTSESGRGVLLAETKTGNYCLVALYKDNAYDVRLFRNEQCTPVGPTFEEGEGTYFLAGDTYLYNYPCLTAAKAQEPLPRGTKLSLLTVVRPDEGGEHGGPFAFVEWQGASRAAVQGYVPLSFLTEVDPAGEVREDFVIGKLKTEGEVVFTAEDGSETALHSGTAVRLFAREDGSYEAHYTDENGKEYTAVISANQVEIGASEAWRIALIVTLAVLACIIIGAAVYLIPRKPKN